MLCIIFVVLLFNCQIFFGAHHNEVLREELLCMVDKDQDILKEFFHSEKGDNTIFERVQLLNMQHIQRMKEIIKQYGWPGYALVGEDGAHAAFLLVQHADNDLLFQKFCLELLQKAVKNADADVKDYAYLVDRVLVNNGCKQRYGTQLDEHFAVCPVEDFSTIDALRAQVGLGPLQDYIEYTRDYYATFA